MKVVLKRLVYVPALMILSIVAITWLHARFNVCPIKFKRFEEDERISIVYGLPSRTLIDRAISGEVVLGGCVVGPFKSVCPHCRWAASFR